MTAITLKQISFVMIVPLLAASCASSDFKLVQKATASATYYQDHYVTVCVEKAGPATCAPCQTTVNFAAKEIPLANKVQKIGPMPAKEVAELQDLLKQLSECP